MRGKGVQRGKRGKGREKGEGGKEQALGPTEQWGLQSRGGAYRRSEEKLCQGQRKTEF